MSKANLIDLPASPTKKVLQNRCRCAEVDVERLSSVASIGPEHAAMASGELDLVQEPTRAPFYGNDVLVLLQLYSVPPAPSPAMRENGAVFIDHGNAVHQAARIYLESPDGSPLAKQRLGVIKSFTAVASIRS